MRTVFIGLLSLCFFFANGVRAGDCCFEQATFESKVMDCHQSDHHESQSLHHADTGAKEKGHAKEACLDECCKITARLPLGFTNNQVATLVGFIFKSELQLTRPKNVHNQLLRPPIVIS